MSRTEGINLASGGKTQGFLLASHPREGRLMKALNRTGTESALLRLLIPVNAEEDSTLKIQYALNRHLEGTELEIILLNVGEPVGNGGYFGSVPRRFRSFSPKALRRSLKMRPPCLNRRTFLIAEYLNKGVGFSILDTAEELECDEIVLPVHQKGLQNIFSRGVTSAIQRNQRDIPVVFVDRDGEIS